MMLTRTARAALRSAYRTVPLASRVQAETRSSPLAAAGARKALHIAGSVRSLHTSLRLRSEASTTAPDSPTPTAVVDEAKDAEADSTPSAAPSPPATAPLDNYHPNRVMMRQLDPKVMQSDVEKMIEAALGEKHLTERVKLQRRRLMTVYASIDFKDPQHAERLISLAPKMGEFEPVYYLSKPPIQTTKPAPTPIQRDPYRLAIVGLPADISEEEVRKVAELSVGAQAVEEVRIVKKRHNPQDPSTSRIAYLRFADSASVQRLLSLSPPLAGVQPRYRLATADDRTDWVTPKTAPRSDPQHPGPSSSSAPLSPNLVPDSLKTKTSSKPKPAASIPERARGVFVGGLNPAITSVALREAITRALDCGPESVLNARVALDAVGKSKGMAFVELRNSNFVNRLLPLAPTLLDSSPDLTLSRARPSPRPFAAEDIASAPQNPPSNRLWVGHLPPLVTESLLEKAFGRVGGRVRRITLVEERDKRTKAPRMSAYLTMQTVTEAQRILDAARTEQGIRVAGSQLVMGFASSRREGNGSERERPAPKRGAVVAREVKGKSVGPRRTVLAPTRFAQRELPVELLEPERLRPRTREERERERPRMLPRDDDGVDVGSNALADLFRKF